MAILIESLCPFRELGEYESSLNALRAKEQRPDVKAAIRWVLKDRQKIS